MVLVDLALAWGRIGLLGFGGGPAMIALMKAECVDAHPWVSDGEFLDALAMNYALPGPITAKMSAFVGFKAAGIPGAVVALLAANAPPFVLMLLLVGIYMRFRDAPWMQGAMKAVRPAVVAMMVWVVVDLGPDGVTGWRTAVLGVVALAALLLRVHPAVVLLGAMAAGALVLR